MRNASAIVLACIAFTGCGGGGDDLPRVALNGTVTHKGQPLKAASLNFVPSDPKAPGVTGIVTDGKFTVIKAQGPIPGAYKVEASPIDANAAAAPEPTPGKSTRGRAWTQGATAEVAKSGKNSNEQLLTTEITIPAGQSAVTLEIDFK
jgi:hypothetical protein